MNNVLLAVACASVLLGTLYPLFLDALNLGKISVGPPYFDSVFVPIMAPLVFLMGIGPIARWKKAELPDLAVRLKWALGVSLATALIFLHRGSLDADDRVRPVPGVLGHRVGRGRHQGAREAHQGGLWARLAAQGRAYWGMQLAHLGVAVFIIGVTLVKGYEVERDVRMDIGDSVTVGNYSFKFEGTREVQGRTSGARAARSR